MPITLCLAGPTATGKTAAALAIAERHGCEIISVDSALVYRGMNIGTAKPTVAELASVPHHLINIRDPLQAYSAADFVRDSTALMQEIRARGKQPLLVGGTMLYFKSLFDGIDDMPPADVTVRADIEARAKQIGWPALHAELAQVDADTAARLAPADSQRIQRALEVYRITGMPLSHWHQQKQPRPNQPQNAIKSEAADAYSISAYRLISLEPANRAWLHARIAQRFESMLAAGLLDEVRALRARGDLHPDLPSMRCVGYRQAWAALDGTLPLPELCDRGIFATRQLAKRQITWLRSMLQRHVIAADAPDAFEKTLQAAQEVLE